MRTKAFPIFLSLMVLLAAGRAAAQPSSASLQPAPDLPRFDASVGFGWFNGTFDGVAAGRQWYNDAAWLGGQFGYYLTENIKLEAEVSGSGEGRGWSSEEGLGPSGRPFYLSREHGLSARTVSAAIVYQFGHNLPLHPFIGAGVDVDFARNVVRTTGFYVDDPRGSEPLPPAADATFEDTRAGAFAVVGVKAYFTERVFFRGDFKAGTSGPERKIIGRAGIGVDF